MTEIERATTQELFDELKRRHIASVLILMREEPGTLPARHSHVITYCSGYIPTCLGMLAIARRRLLGATDGGGP